MGMSEELQRLAELHESGALTDAEFAQAKRKVLDQYSRADGPTSVPSTSRRPGGLFDELRDDSEDQSLGRAANRYVSLQIVMAVVGLIVFLIVASQMFGSNGPPGFGP